MWYLLVNTPKYYSMSFQGSPRRTKAWALIPPKTRRSTTPIINGCPSSSSYRCVGGTLAGTGVGEDERVGGVREEESEGKREGKVRGKKRKGREGRKKMEREERKEKDMDR